MPPDLPFADLIDRLQDGDPDASCLIFNRYVRRLVCVAAARLPHILSPKLDPEDVVQSVFRSFFTRHREGHFALDDWDKLWTLLAVLTVRKCGHRVEHFHAARRDVRREIALRDAPNSSGTAGKVDALTPSPVEALLLAETVAVVLQSLGPVPRTIVQLRLEGYSGEEISRQVHRTERTVYRILEKVRVRLEPSLAGSETP